MTDYSKLNCEQLRQHIKVFNEDKNNWYRKIAGAHKMKKDELITLCMKCDKARYIKRKTQPITHKDFFYWVLEECSVNAKKGWCDLDMTAEDEYIEIEYEWNIFANCSTTQSAILFFAPHGETPDGGVKKCCIPTTYNTSSPLALWLSGFENDDEESDVEPDEEEREQQKKIDEENAADERIIEEARRRIAEREATRLKGWLASKQ
jgi:hypothetical protein